VGLLSRHFDNNVYAQIGLIMLIGLTAKNAILIVEFARQEREEGKSIMDAALGAARIRLRPILMTSLAFVFGCLPLWIAMGAGAASRRMLGTAVVSGMLAATLLGIFFIPALFVGVEKLATRKGARSAYRHANHERHARSCRTIAPNHVMTARPDAAPLRSARRRDRADPLVLGDGQLVVMLSR
jgi:predicted RND superfamily exporter protein